MSCARLSLLCVSLLLAGRQARGEPDAGTPTLPALETVVTATRQPRPTRDVAASVTVLPREEIERSPTLTTDGLLRTVPSVATFRRSSSLAADPSSQGLNLRGLGPSGVSRALVLWDGVPMNDPFGGWVYWRALPRLGLQRVEVVPSGGSAQYGSSALGGVVQLFSRGWRSGGLDADASYGSYATAFGGVRGGYHGDGAGFSVEVEGLRSDGFPVVEASQRGPIDQATPSAHATANAEVGFRHRNLELSLRLGGFHEDQNGGTELTRARVDLGHASLLLRADFGERGTLEARAFGKLQRFLQDRARVSPGRQSETLAGWQNVPTQEQGAALSWALPALRGGGDHHLLVGADFRRVAGEARENIFSSAASQRITGGEQLFGGVFVQDSYEPIQDRLSLELALRADIWRNANGRRELETSLERFPDRGGVQLSPRVGALVRVSDALRLRASAFRAFRVPTLNELYRPFQVGTVLTAANEALEPESVLGGEAGVELGPFESTLVRAVGFYNALDAPISNVTAAGLAGGATRLRQNLGAAHVRGAELSVETRFATRFTALLGYTLADSRVVSAPEVPDLVGKRLAQAPVHRGNLSLTFDEPRWFSATVALRVVGPQFEDDLNTLPMGGYPLVDVAVSRRLLWGLEVFGAVENLFNRVYLVGRSGVDTVGTPFLARVGLRYRGAR